MISDLGNSIPQQKMTPFKQTDLYQIRCCELGVTQEINIVALVEIMQETSMRHVLRLNSSAWDLASENLTWVLIRKELHVKRYPHLNETIRVVTYPSGFEKVLAYRDFKVYDDNQRLIAWASSTWTLMNTKSRKLERIPQRFLEMTTPVDEVILDRPGTNLNSLSQKIHAKDYRIGYFDLDWNGHVNNTSYLRLMIDSLPLELLNMKRLLSINFQIKSESLYNQVLSLFYIDTEEGFLHEIMLGENLIALGKSNWTEK